MKSESWQKQRSSCRAVNQKTGLQMISSGCGWSQLLLHLHWHFPAEMIQICWRCLSGTAICWNGKQSSDSAGQGGSSKLVTDALCSIKQTNSRLKGEVSKENLHILRYPGMGEAEGMEEDGTWAGGSNITVQTSKCLLIYLTESMQLPFGATVVRNSSVISLLIQKNGFILRVTCLSSAVPWMMVLSFQMWEHERFSELVAMSPVMCAVACLPWHVCSACWLCYAGLLVGHTTPAECVTANV